MKITYLLVLATIVTACAEMKFESQTAGSDFTDIRKPVDEVEDDPTLIEQYACSTGGSSKKVMICHIPPGNPAAKHTICIGRPALRAHYEHEADNGESDYLGACGDNVVVDDPDDDDDGDPTPTPSPTPVPTGSPAPTPTPAPDDI